jgi:hypothetical protein
MIRVGVPEPVTAVLLDVEALVLDFSADATFFVGDGRDIRGGQPQGGDPLVLVRPALLGAALETLEDREAVLAAFGVDVFNVIRESDIAAGP